MEIAPTTNEEQVNCKTTIQTKLLKTNCITNLIHIIVKCRDEQEDESNSVKISKQ